MIRRRLNEIAPPGQLKRWAPARPPPARLPPPTEKGTLMFQQLVKMSLAGIAMLAVASLSGVAQSPLPAPPQIPYGMSISTDNAKEGSCRVDSGSAQEQVEYGNCRRRYQATRCTLKRCRTRRPGASTWRSRHARRPCSGGRPGSFRTRWPPAESGLRVLRLTGAIPNEGCSDHCGGKRSSGQSVSLVAASSRMAPAGCQSLELARFK